MSRFTFIATFLCLGMALNVLSVSLQEHKLDLTMQTQAKGPSESEFGKSLLLMVQERLHANAPVDDVLKLLATVEKRVKTDQAEEDLANARNKMHCSQTVLPKKLDELKRKTEDMRSIRDDEASFNGTVEAHTTEIQALHIELQAVDTDIATQDAEIAQQKQQYGDELTRVRALLSDHRNATRVVSELIRHVLKNPVPSLSSNSSTNSNSSAGSNSSANAAGSKASLLQLDIGTYNSAHMESLVRNAVQIVDATLDASTAIEVNSLVDLLKQLKQSLVKSKLKLLDQVKVLKREWKDLQARLKIELDVLHGEAKLIQDAILAKTTFLNGTANKSSFFRKRLDELETLVHALRDELLQEKNLCDKRATDYEIHTSKRIEELRVIEEVRALIKREADLETLRKSLAATAFRAVNKAPQTAQQAIVQQELAKAKAVMGNKAV